jgi:hypothetical protein
MTENAMPDERHCSKCVHIRYGAPPDPLAGIRLVSKKVLELKARWQKELETRATFEQERMLAGEPFDFEPYAFPYCDLYSKEKAVDPITSKERVLYVLCATANPKGDCRDFLASEPS